MPRTPLSSSNADVETVGRLLLKPHDVFRDTPSLRSRHLGGSLEDERTESGMVGLLVALERSIIPCSSPVRMVNWQLALSKLHHDIARFYNARFGGRRTSFELRPAARDISDQCLVIAPAPIAGGNELMSGGWERQRARSRQLSRPCE